MGKEGDLWDDSALIKAFRQRRFQIEDYAWDGVATEEKNTDRPENIQVAEADNGSQEFRSSAECVENDNSVDSVRETTAKIYEVPSLLPIEESAASEHVGSSGIQNGNEFHPTKVVAWNSEQMVSSDDVKFQTESAWYSNGQDEYNQLLNKYYSLEEQRQKVIQQLNQYNSWNYQNPVSTTFTSEEHKEPISQSYYENITCSCPYGCQNWVVPCNSYPPRLSGSCMDKSCNSASKGADDADIVKTAMVTGERALCSLTKEASNDDNSSANGGKEKELGVEMGHFTETTKPTTHLDVVLKAWYSAGFYTGKYLSEQSCEKGKRG